MKKNLFYLLLILPTLLLSFSCQSTNSESSNANEEIDLLAIIYDLADKKQLKVITDINMGGGAWYGTIEPQAMADSMTTYIASYHQKYGNHPSFYGWYLNHEINPIKLTDTAQTAFWQTVWKAATDACHQANPKSVVTVSPFFLLDKDALRGFEFLQPDEYQTWWAQTLSYTGIDILMLQDSGAEHQGFFSLEERKPFFAAFKKACEQAGTEFWLNVETGQVDAKNWNEALEMERTKSKNWVFTPIDWLEKKLQLASEYGTGIVNWGYFPLMNPIQEIGPWPKAEVDGQDISFEGQLKAYNDYKNYYQQVKQKSIPESKISPTIQGTLWMLRNHYDGWSKEQITKSLSDQMDAQKDIGFDILWIINTPEHVNFTKI